MYENEPEVWDRLYQLLVEDWEYLEKHGLQTVSSGKFYPIILGNKGDWSYLASCSVGGLCIVAILKHLVSSFRGCVEVSSANLTRSYRRAPKSAGANRGANAAPPAGVCHLCLAGTDGHDWESLQLGASFLLCRFH